MNNIERIVADFETCKRAVGMGIKLDTVFVHDFNHFKEKNVVHLSYEEDYTSSFPAPTAEEVPLPSFQKPVKIQGRNFYCLINNVLSFDTYPNGWSLATFRIESNEATARLKMAIWLIENVPEARQWYVKNGYLKEVNRDRD